MINLGYTLKDIDTFIHRLKDKTHTNPYLCMQCLTCSNGCPYVEAMDHPPNHIIRYLQLGFLDRAITSNTIWICVGCNTCSSECPMAIDIPAIFDFLKEESLRKNIYPDIPDILKFHQAVLNSIKKYGRTHKLGIMIEFKLHSKGLLRDINIGLKMFYKQKLSLIPSSIKSTKEIQKLFDKDERK